MNKAIADIRLRSQLDVVPLDQFQYTMQCQIRAAPVGVTKYALFHVTYSWQIGANMTHTPI